MTERPTRIVKPEVLRDLMERLLSAAGCTDVNARETAEVFLEADLRGIGLQGFDHLFDMLDDIRRGAVFATDLAIRKAREAGTATVGLVNGADIYMIGYYTDRMARAGMVGFVFSASSSLVHPHGGVERKLGTNPIAIAVPTAGADPVLLDMAPSVLSSSRIRQAAYHGEHVPPGSGVDVRGQPTTEAAAIDAGAICPPRRTQGFRARPLRRPPLGSAGGRRGGQRHRRLAHRGRRPGSARAPLHGYRSGCFWRYGRIPRVGEHISRRGTRLTDRSRRRSRAHPGRAHLHLPRAQPHRRRRDTRSVLDYRR